MANDLGFLKVWANANKSKQTTKRSLSEFLNEPEYELTFEDGTTGKVGFKAYQAIKENHLDSYTPYNEEEKKIIDKYRLYTGAELTKDDGSSLGFVSKEGLKAIEENNTDNYTPINAEEDKTIKSYIEYATKKRQEKIDKYKSTAQEKVVTVEQEKAKTVEEAGKLRREKAATKRSTGLINPEEASKWKSEDTRTGIEKREGKSIPESEGVKELEALEKKYENLDEEADALVGTISDIEKYANVVYKETGWLDQSKANYTKGRLSQDTAQAYNDYIVSPTEGNRMRADALSSLSEQFISNNKNALITDDEDVSKISETVRDWVAVSFAGYLPQLFDQTKASVKGAAKGGVTGAAVGSVVPGIGTATGFTYGLKAGWVAGASQQMYETTRGMVFKSLIDAGYDEETALAAANDEAFISSIIEGTGEIISMATLGTGKLVGKIAPNVAKKVSSNVVTKGVKGFVKKTGKTISKNVFLKTTISVAGVVLNAVGEYAEEYSQEAVSIANERRLKNPNASGKLNLTGETISLLRNMDAETEARLHAAGTEGFRIGLMMGGTTKAGTTTFENAITARTGKKIKESDSEQSGLVQSIIDVGLKQSPKSLSYKLATKLNQNDKISNYELGKLVNANKQETVNVGDEYYDTKSKSTLKVINRDEISTTIESTSADGNTITKVFLNKNADNLVNSNRFVLVDIAQETVVADENSTTENVAVAENSTTTTETVVPQAEMPSVKVGDVYEATENGYTYTITARNDTHTTYTVTDKNGNTITRQARNTSADVFFNHKEDFTKLYTGVKVGDVYKNNESGVTYTVVSRDSNETTIRNNQNSKTTTMSNAVADDMFAYEDAYTKVQGDNTATTTEAENQPVTDESATSNETTPSEENVVEGVKIADVVNAMNETFVEGAKEEIFESMERVSKKKGVAIKKDIATFAESVVRAYKKHGTLGHIADHFVDKGVKVISVIEGKTDVIENTTDTTTQTVDNKTSTQPATISETETVAEAKNEVVTEETTTDNKETTTDDVDLAEGEILTLKHTNIYQAFKGAEKIYIGKDCITDGFVLIPLTDKNLEAVKKVAKKAKIENKPDFSLEKVYNKDNDVIIQGNPKVYDDNIKSMYVFKINNKFYVAQQKYIDAFATKNTVIKANSKNSASAWTVHDKNGNIFMAIIMPVRNDNITDDIYNNAKTVSEVKAEKAQQKEAKAAEKAETERQNAEHQEQATQKRNEELERRKGLSTPEELITLREKYEGKEFTDGEHTYKVVYLEDKAWFEFAIVKEDGTLGHFGARLIEPSADAMEQHISLLEKLNQNNEKNKEFAKAEEEKKEKEQAIKDEEEKYINAYVVGMKPMLATKIKNTLSKYFNTDLYGNIKLHKVIENAVKDGHKLEAKDVNGKMSYRLYKDDNLFFDINKTAYDYGKYLENNNINDGKDIDLPFVDEETTDKPLQNQSESDTMEEKNVEESAKDVHERVLDRESGNNSAVREPEFVQEAEKERNVGTEDREFGENVTTENGAHIQSVETETSTTEQHDIGNRDNGIRKSDNGDGDSRVGVSGNDNVDDEVTDDTAKVKESKSKDYSITKAVAEELDTKAPNIDDNISAIETLHELENSGKAPTKTQQSILAKFKGWGGLSNAFWSARSRLKEIMSDSEISAAQSTVNDAYFTPTTIIDSIYKGLNHLGFEGGNILEPSMGVGNFFGRMPKSIKDISSLFGVEIDTISGKIAQYLYPSANIEIAPFQDVAYKDGSFDLIIGNVPFGEVKYKYKNNKYLIHDYFFVKAMDKLNDGGIMVFLTSKGTLDKLDSTTRAELNRQGNIIGAYRLPSNVFSRSAGANVVTDLIIMQKTTNNNGEKFVNTGNVKLGNENFSINEYFVNHPENIIGELTYRRGQYGKYELTVQSTGDVAEQLTKAIRKLPKNLLSGVQTVGTTSVMESTSKLQTFYINDKGNVEYIDAQTGEVKELKNTVKNKNNDIAKDYLAIKKSYTDLTDYTLNDAELSMVESKRQELNALYDDFVKKHGTFENNKKLLSADNDFYKLSGLEVYDTKTKKIIKSEMFTKDTIGKRKPKKADNALDALSISMGESGTVNLKRISELTNLSVKEVVEQLSDRIIYTPDGNYELNEVYLSGNVREKYEAVKGKKGFEKNEQMLKAVIPEDIPAKSITPQFGAAWIEPKYVAQFMQETFQLRSTPKVVYDSTTGTWSISGNTWGDTTLMINKYGTKYLDAVQLAEKALNMRQIVVKNKDGVILGTETKVAQQKALDIKNAFEEWCFKDTDRRNDLVETFNKKFNSNRNMDFSELAKYLTFNGLSETFELRDYQKRAVARAIFNGNTLLAHGVGTGKTAEMITIAMELKRMGMAKKNMMVVPPNKVADFRNDILKMYPSAKVAMLEKGANATQRQRFYAQVAANDFDIVIIPHSSFGLLDVSKDTKIAFINNQISELEEVLTTAQLEKGSIDGRFIRQLENQKKRLEEKLKFITESKKDNGNTFEELGVDSLFVDEAHNFKNLPFYTKLSRVAGVSAPQNNNKDRASRAENMFMITDYLNRNNGRITFGTATPITKSISEIYNMTRFLRPDILRDSGLQSFDAWASMFGSIVNKAEAKPSGRGMRMKERFSKFRNVPQMIEQFRRMADILKSGEVIDDLPVAERINVINPSNEIQEEFLDILEEIVTDIQTNGARSEYNMLQVTKAGEMAALDLRMVVSYFDGKYTLDDLNLPNNRTFQVAERVYKEYTESNANKGTQFVFCDAGVYDNPNGTYGFHVYGDLINKLVAFGIPRNEIAVAQEFEDKADLSAKVNTGEIRVLIGSTAVMGEGMNAQQKAVALHHMTIPDNPAGLEQREGRIIRFGNENKNVRIYRYIQEASYDSYKWQMQERKADIINQALSGGTVEELEEMSDFQLSAREAKAIASGNPLLLEKIEIEDKITNLKTLRKKFNTDKLEMQERLATLPNRIRKIEKIITDTKADIKTIDANQTKDFVITLGKTKYTERAKAAEALERGTLRIPKNGTVVKIGSYRGLDLFYCSSVAKGTEFILEGAGKYTVMGGDSALGNVTRLINAVEKIPEKLSNDEILIKKYNSELSTLGKEVNNEFPQAKELAELETKLSEIDTALGINVSEVDMSDVFVEDDTEEVDVENVQYSIESEEDYERERNLLHNDSKQWYASEYSGEQVAGLAKAAERGSKTAKERKTYTARLKQNQLDKKILVDKDGNKHMFVEIKPSAWNGQMNKIADYYAQKGVNVHFIKGGVRIAFVGENKTANAMRVGNDIYISYDNEWYSPEQLSMHEYIHIKYGSPEFQRIVQDILETLPKREYNNLVDKVKKAYGDVVDIIENPYAYEEEVICDVLSGMTPSSLLKSGEVVLKFWARESADMLGYDASQYAESIDAGGVKEITLNDVWFIDENNQLKQGNLNVPQSEYSQLKSFIIDENYSNKLKAVSCKEIGNNFYVWKNLSKNNFKIEFVIPIVGNDVVCNFIRSGLNGINRKNKGISNLYKSFYGRYGNGVGGSIVNPNRQSTIKNGRVLNATHSKRQTNLDRRRNIGESNRNTEVNKINYSLATDGILDLDDLWDDAIERYGTIPKGENPVRDIDVPKKISPDDVVSRFARTMLEAGVTPDESVSDFEKAILDGTMTHEVITNKNASAWAREQIEYLGFEEALNKWTVLSDSGKVGKKEFALGMELYNQCITNKDVKNAMKIAAELVAEATNAGQTLQSTRMLKLMTPDGQLYYLEKSVQKMNDEFREKLGDKYEDIELDENLMEDFLTETDEEKRNAIYDNICQDIADQIPATKLDKWNSWRYLAMLGNVRTHMRNISGNAVFIPSIRIKNYIGAVIEKMAKVDTSERTKSFRKSEEAIEFAENDFEEMAKVLQGENAKYAVTSDIEGKRTIFKTEWLEKLRLKNFEFLEKEDMWFLKMHYIDALARLITVRNIDVTSIDTKTLEKIRAIALKEAQAATYRDANSLAEGLNVLQRKLERSGNKAKKGVGILLEGVMPFKKTPMNIAKQGINYSPIGILKGVYNALTKLKTGGATITDVIDDFAKGLTGTGMMLLGLLLAKLGVLVGAGDKPDKEKEFDKMVGEQDYSINIGDWSYTIDWATPSNLSLFIGAELYNLTKDEFKFSDIVSAVSTITEPLLELSVFNGVNGVIESAQYSDSSPLLAIVSDMATSYFMQALPTIGGQLSRIIDADKKEYYYVDKNKNIPKGMQRLIGQASSKIPFASYLFETSVDEWGREETYGKFIERVGENILSPGYYSKENYTAVDKVLKDLYEKTGETSVLPITQQKYYEDNYIRYDMTAKEYTEAKKMRGQKSFEYVSDVINNKKTVKLQNKTTGKYQNKLYSNMSDEEKVRAIKKCYEDAGTETKETMLEKIKLRKTSK